MMPLLRLDKVSLVYGPRPLLDRVQLDMRSGERVCLVGRNGEGKSSLMRIVNGELAPDDGEVWRRPGVRIAHLAQEVSVDSEESVFDIVATPRRRRARVRRSRCASTTTCLRRCVPRG